MRILNLLKYYPPYPGGIENIACDLVETLAARGVRETVICHGNERYESGNGVRQVLAANYGELLYAPVAPSFPWKFFREIYSGQHDLLHIHMPNVSAFLALWQGVKIPMVVHWHSDVVFPQNKKICRTAYRGYALFERALLARAAAVVPTSEAYLEYSRPLAEFRHKCSVIPLGLDFSRMTSLPDSILPAEKRRWTGGRNSFLVVSAGRFSHYKGFNYLIDAVSGMDDVSVVIAGDGEMRQELLARVKAAGLEDRIVLPGRLSDYDLHTLMAASDVFCLPSVERSEAFGVVLLEAMFYGRPLITTAIKGSATSWVNLDGETGLVVPVEDPAAIAEAIATLKADPQRCAEMGRAGRDRLKRNFSITATAESFYRLYAGLL